MPSLPFPSPKKLCIYTLSFLSFLLTLAITLFIIPWYRAHSYEVSYFTEILRLEDLDSEYASVDIREMLDIEQPPAYNTRRTPLIQDIPQLRSWDWQEMMRLHPDGTAPYTGQEFWIYVGGTPKKSLSFPFNWWDNLSLFSRPAGSCVDEDYICAAFNRGFDRLVERYHTHGKERTSGASLAFVDCDVSPLFCDEWAVDPVMLAHIESVGPCRKVKGEVMRAACTVKYRSVSLPLKTMPFSRKEMVGGKKGVPVEVFPSAEEQVRQLVMWDGVPAALQAMGNEVFEVVADAIPRK
ncbi:uncharacterized protein BP5553_09506 [Venustampulla echinocandica]|uniref:Uncharacterized protein n=1 Tax=Venustampulla echinocandica TaxID=2656787 RepID=A0A370TD05_9HELO|nr:uncharacterized protein BP5553_09506 [Venustampulla echinocandica]RDL32104.1 hypothetical protein BP5553_09506 [Venustampulla echinocandica]